MKLNTLKINEGSKKIVEKLDSKVDNYHYIEDYQKEDLVTQTLR